MSLLSTLEIVVKIIIGGGAPASPLPQATSRLSHHLTLLLSQPAAMLLPLAPATVLARMELVYAQALGQETALLNTMVLTATVGWPSGGGTTVSLLRIRTWR